MKKFELKKLIKEELSLRDAIKIKRILISYTYPGSRFYKAYFYLKNGERKTLNKDETNAFLKRIGIEVEGGVGDKYNSEEIINSLRSKGFEADEDEMDVS